MTQKKLWFAVIMLTLLVVQTAAAQHPYVIVVKMLDCTPEKAWIAIEGSDFPLMILDRFVQLKGDRQIIEWHGRDLWPDKRKNQTRPPKASLRLAGTRTFCHEGTYGKRGAADAVIFEFACDENKADAHDLEVIALRQDFKSMLYKYERAFKTDTPQASDIDKCIQTGEHSGKGTIRDVRMGDETVKLRFGRTPTPLKFNKDEMKKLEKLDKPLELERNDVLFKFIDERAKGELESPPLLSSVAIDLDQKALGKDHFHSITVKVLK